MSTPVEWMMMLREEMAKLDSPAPEMLDVARVRELCAQLVAAEVHDLRVESYALWAELKEAVRAAADDGAAAGVAAVLAITTLCERLEHCDTFDPAPERRRARESLGRWLVVKVEHLLLNEALRCDPLALDEALVRLSAALHRHGCDEPGAWTNLRTRLAARNMPLAPQAEPAAQTAAPAVRTLAPTTPLAAPEVVAAPQIVAAPKDAPLDLWPIGEAHLPLAIHHIVQTPENSDAWQLYLTHLWLGLVATPPAEARKTRIAASPPGLLAPLAACERAQLGEVLAPLLSEQLPRHRLELSLWHELARALMRLDCAQAARIVRSQCRALCARLEGLETLLTQSERPLCDEATLVWLTLEPRAQAPHAPLPAQPRGPHAPQPKPDPVPFELLCGQLAALAQLAHGAHAFAQSHVFKESPV